MTGDVLIAFTSEEPGHSLPAGSGRRGSIGRKILSSFAGVIVITVLLALVGFQSIGSVRSAARDLEAAKSAALTYGEATTWSVRAESAERGYITQGEQRFCDEFESDVAQFEEVDRG